MWLSARQQNDRISDGLSYALDALQIRATPSHSVQSVTPDADWLPFGTQCQAARVAYEEVLSQFSSCRPVQEVALQAFPPGSTVSARLLAPVPRTGQETVLVKVSLSSPGKMPKTGT